MASPEGFEQVEVSDGLNHGYAEPPPAEHQMSFDHSPSIGKLIGALAIASKSFTPVKKDTNNTFYSSKYAPLENLVDATREFLGDNGLAVIQMPRLNGQEVEVYTLLGHSSGEWISSSLKMPAVSFTNDKDAHGNKIKVTKFDAQTVGIAITYARRYTYGPMLNIAGEVDDDANGLVGTKEAAQEAGKKQLADYTIKVKDAVKGKVLEYTILDLAGITTIALVPGPIVSGMMEFGLKELTVYSDSLKTRIMAAADIDSLIKVAEPLGITVKEKASTPAPKKPGVKYILSASEQTSPKQHKQFLKVMYGTDDVIQELACFVPGLWDDIVRNIHNPAEFVLDAKGKYIQGITSLNGRGWSQMEDGTRTPDRLITDDDLPEMMRP